MFTSLQLLKIPKEARKNLKTVGNPKNGMDISVKTVQMNSPDV